MKRKASLMMSILFLVSLMFTQEARAGETDASAISFRGFTSLQSDDTTFETDSVFTLEIWFRTTKTNGVQLLTHEDQSVSNFAQLRVNPTNTTVRFIVRDEANNLAAVDSPTELADGLWHHAAGVRDGATLRLYIDGMLVRETTDNTSVANLNIDGPVKIGRWQSGSGATLLEVDEARIWHTARTAAEIANNRLSSVAVDSAGLVGYWPMAAGSGTTVTDVTGAGNDLAFVDSGSSSPQWAGRAWLGGASEFGSAVTTGVGVDASAVISDVDDDVTLFPSTFAFGVSSSNLPAEVTTRWTNYFLLSVNDVVQPERGGNPIDITFDISDAGGSGVFDPNETYSLLRRNGETSTGTFVVMTTQNTVVDGDQVTFTVDSSLFSSTFQQITIGTNGDVLAVQLNEVAASSVGQLWHIGVLLLIFVGLSGMTFSRIQKLHLL